MRFGPYPIDARVVGGTTPSVTIGENTTASVQTRLLSGAWGSAVIVIEASNDEVEWFTLVSPNTSAVSASQDVTKYAFMRGRVSVIDAGAGMVDVTFCLKRT